ncbi:unnamed protein product [Arabidopsis halleri]
MAISHPREKKVPLRWLCNVMTKAKRTHSLLTLHPEP